MKKWLNKIEWGLLWTLPVVVFFSYLPVIKLGANETMNFELSLPLIWLAVFGILSLRKIRLIWKKLGKYAMAWLLFVIFATISVIWSLNLLRGILTAGIGWLILLSVLNIIYCIRPTLKQSKKLLNIHVYAGVATGILCLAQCFLDVFGVDRAATGLCAGCTYQAIGFPHPNGLAIEPQFMGNLLILPALLSLLFLYDNIKSNKSNYKIGASLALTFFLIMVLFITFSRGAIYSFMLGVICLIAYACVKLHKFSTLWALPLIVAAFCGGLLCQGLLAQLSPTNENFQQGITRSIEQMSLGVIDFEEEIVADSNFNGYIEESTEIRLSLNEAALTAWKIRPIFGVGLGGAGTAIHSIEPSLSSKEIIQNELFQILLELGIVGVGFVIILLIATIRTAAKNKTKSLACFVCLLIMYGASMMFFSGLPNVLHIYLMTPVAYLLFKQYSYAKI